MGVQSSVGGGWGGVSVGVWGSGFGSCRGGVCLCWSQKKNKTKSSKQKQKNHKKNEVKKKNKRDPPPTLGVVWAHGIVFGVLSPGTGVCGFGVGGGGGVGLGCFFFFFLGVLLGFFVCIPFVFCISIFLLCSRKNKILDTPRNGRVRVFSWFGFRLWVGGFSSDLLIVWVFCGGGGFFLGVRTRVSVGLLFFFFPSLFHPLRSRTAFPRLRQIIPSVPRR